MPDAKIKTSFRVDNPAEMLVKQIIQHARDTGIDQAELARRAGISAESLSRLKNGGRCRLATALGLAQAAGFSEILLTIRETERSAASVAVRKLNSGRQQEITVQALIEALGKADSLGLPLAHFFGFFEELPLELVHDVILDEGLDFGVLAAFARKIGAEGEIVEWLEEMASYSMANAS